VHSIRFTLVGRALDQAQKHSSASPWMLPGFPDRKHTEAGPSKLSGKALRLGPGSSIGTGRVGRIVTRARDSPPTPGVGRPASKAVWSGAGSH
jgi:hypothetical protein